MAGRVETSGAPQPLFHTVNTPLSQAGLSHASACAPRPANRDLTFGGGHFA
jgi:hypothetical protein